MFLYWSIWFVIYLFSILANEKLLSKLIYFVFIIFLIIFVGLRYEIGVDWDTYLIFYETIKDFHFKEAILFTEPLYGLLNYISSILEFDDTVFVNLICAIILFFTFFVFSKKINNYWVPLLVSYTYFIVVVSMNYTRQSVAVAFSLLAFYYALRKNIIKFIIFVILATLFHKSAIVLLVYIPLIYFNNTNINIFFKISYTLFSLFFITFILFYSSLSSDSLYLGAGEDLNSSGAIFRVFLHVFPVLLFLCYRRVFRECYKENLIILDYSLLLIVYCLFLAFLYSTLADRFNLYLLFFDIIVFSFLSRFFKLNKKLILLSLIFFYYSVSFYIWFDFGTYADDGWIPYQNYLFNFLTEIF